MGFAPLDEHLAAVLRIHFIPYRRDDDAKGGKKYKAYNTSRLDSDGFPPCVREGKLFSSKVPDQDITSVDSADDFTQLAVGRVFKLT
jgi:hypothetical protein